MPKMPQAPVASAASEQALAIGVGEDAQRVEIGQERRARALEDALVGERAEDGDAERVRGGDGDDGEDGGAREAGAMVERERDRGGADATRARRAGRARGADRRAAPRRRRRASRRRASRRRGGGGRRARAATRQTRVTRSQTASASGKTMASRRGRSARCAESRSKKTMSGAKMTASSSRSSALGQEEAPGEPQGDGRRRQWAFSSADDSIARQRAGA